MIIRDIDVWKSDKNLKDFTKFIKKLIKDLNGDGCNLKLIKNRYGTLINGTRETGYLINIEGDEESIHKLKHREFIVFGGFAKD